MIDSCNGCSDRGNDVLCFCPCRGTRSNRDSARSPDSGSNRDRGRNCGKSGSHRIDSRNNGVSGTRGGDGSPLACVGLSNEERLCIRGALDERKSLGSLLHKAFLIDVAAEVNAEGSDDRRSRAKSW